MADDQREAWPRRDNPWTITNTGKVHSNEWFEVEQNAVVRPDGSHGSYEVVRIRVLGVGILPIDAHGFVHMIGQWRLPLGRYSWEMPEGGAEAGETPLACAKRELKEETGLSAATWREVLALDLSTSLTDEQAIIFIATDLEAGKPRPDDTEVLAHRHVHFVDVLTAVLDGSVREAMTVSAVLCAQHLATTGVLPAGVAHAMLHRPSRAKA